MNRASNISLAIGCTLGLLTGIIGMGFARQPSHDQCKAVALAYNETRNEVSAITLRGSQEEPLSPAESLAISIAGIVSESLGVSCTIQPGVSA